MTNSYLLELGGKPAGRFQSFEGGTIATELITVPIRSGFGMPKMQSSISVRDLVLGRKKPVKSIF